jgi:preprotein translocase subunit SecF
MRIFSDANYDFLKYRNRALKLSVAFVAIGMVAMLTRGINESIEFTGGTMVEVASMNDDPFDVPAVRAALASSGLDDAEVTPYGGGHELAIRARTSAEGVDAEDTQTTAAMVAAVLNQVQGDGLWEERDRGAVGAKVGGELRTKAALAIFFSFFAVLAYLAMRFEWRFGVAAVIATVHDIILTVCFISIMNVEVGLVVVAAVLSVVGYSLNDTIVIFDRVRENLNTRKRGDLVEVLNRSINETLPRTVVTSGTTLAALLSLLIFAGGSVVRPFAMVMFFGILVGTYSSIFIASPALREIESRWPGVDGHGVKVKGSKAKTRKPQTA